LIPVGDARIVPLKQQEKGGTKPGRSRRERLRVDRRSENFDGSPCCHLNCLPVWLEDFPVAEAVPAVGNAPDGRAQVLSTRSPTVINLRAIASLIPWIALVIVPPAYGRGNGVTQQDACDLFRQPAGPSVVSSVYRSKVEVRVADEWGGEATALLGIDTPATKPMVTCEDDCIAQSNACYADCQAGPPALWYTCRRGCLSQYLQCTWFCHN
jgi:hypothetical protein